MSAGKSTFINSIVGAKVAKVKTTACTSSLTSFHNRPFDDGVFYTKNEKIYPLESGEPYDIETENISVKFLGALDFYPIILQDTPGIDYAYDVTHRTLTENAIAKGEYDAICCIVNTPYVESDGEMEIINKVISAKPKKILFILNQLDRFDPEDDSIDDRLKDFKKMLQGRKSSTTVIPFSARTAMLLKREMSNQLTKTEKMELETLKNRFKSQFYDLWEYATGQQSREDDYFARCGLTFLESEILNNG